MCMELEALRGDSRAVNAPTYAHGPKKRSGGAGGDRGGRGGGRGDGGIGVPREHTAASEERDL